MTVQAPLSFLVFSDDWGEHPSSCQHLFRHIAKDNPTVWVNTVGMRVPQLTLADGKKALRKVRKMLLGERMGAPVVRNHEAVLKLTVCQPPMFPFSRPAACRVVNKALVVHAVRRNLKKMALKRPILMTTVPNACDYIGAFDERAVIYYCVDDFAEWPGHEYRIVREMEAELIHNADILVATSEKLRDRLFREGKPTYLLSHGVDFEHFARHDLEEHPALTNIPRPRVGYFGLFDERSDQRLLAELAKKLPQISFVITGRVEVETSRLNAIPNVYFTGAVAYEDLPSIAAGWAACVLPYVQNKLTDAINPLKLKEYLATGRPVVSTPIPEAVRFAPYVTCCKTIEEWRQTLCSAIDKRAAFPSEDLLNILARENWEAKAAQLLYFAECCSGLQARATAGS